MADPPAPHTSRRPIAPHTSRRRLLVVLAIWAIVMAAGAFGAGCYGRNCEGDILTFGLNEGEGHLIDKDTWESNAVDGRWVDFPKQRFIIFQLKDFKDRTPDLIVPYISAEPYPLRDNGNFTIASGNIAEIAQASKGTFNIHNGTCADYFLRLVVKTSPPPEIPDAASDASQDAAADGPPADASSSDAEGGL